MPLLTLSTAVPSVLRGMMRKLASAEGPTSTTEVLSCSSLNLKSVYSVKLVRLKKLSPSLMAAPPSVAELPPLIQPEVTLTCLPLFRLSTRDAPVRTLTMSLSSSALPKLALSPSTGVSGVSASPVRSTASQLTAGAC